MTKSKIQSGLAAMKLDTVELAGLAPERLDHMNEAAMRVLECYRVLQKSDANIVGEVIKGPVDFYEWDSHSQHYYHAHPPEKRANKWGVEHGHFHTFLRPKGMPGSVKPAALADYEAPEGANDALTHFVGISMNWAGFPIRLFSTNRWVTGEIWYTADDVISMIDRFEIDVALPSWPVNIWITAMVQLFRPQIEALLHRRDKVVADWEAAHPGLNAYEDRNLEITSIIDISVEDQIKKISKALRATA